MLNKSEVFKTSFREDISEEEKIAGLSLLWSEVKSNFVSIERITIERWDHLFFEYLTKVRRSTSTLEYYLLLQKLIALLKDSHTNVYPPEFLLEQIYARPKIQTRMIEEKIIITDVWNEELLSDEARNGLEITSINGLPTRKYAEQYIMPYQSSSTVQDLMTRTYEYALLNGRKDDPVTLELKDDMGKTYRKVLPRVFPISRSRPMLEFTRVNGNIAYVILNTFATPEIVKEFGSIFSSIKSSDALIIDIRNNEGGSSNNGYEILGYLFDGPIRISNWRTRQYLPAFRAWGKRESWYVSNDNNYQPKAKENYKKPVVVLTSSRTISAAEDFGVVFDYARRGVIIGEKTAGCTGQPLMIALPGGGTARIRTKHDSYPDGKEFINVGIQPDITVYPTVEDVRGNRDRVLEKALDYLKGQLK